MCLAVPMEIVELLPEEKALVGQGDFTLKADISLLETARVGDFVIVHAGFALEKLEPGEAAAQIGRWESLQNGGAEREGFG